MRAIKYVGENFPYVKKMFWYNERNQDAGKIQLDNYGLLNRDLSPKPVYSRVKQLLAKNDPVPTPEPTPERAVPVPTPTVDPEPTEEPTPEPTRSTVTRSRAQPEPSRSRTPHGAEPPGQR